ncbi:MAG: 3-hydroxyacyl-CoA dehydrogenase [Yoonia sp.]|jgi:L-gulonate 3-dehydrogenase
MSRIITVIGCGLIGRAWTIVFARAGLDVRVWDADPVALQATRKVLHATCVETGEDPAIMSRVNIASDMAHALEGAEWVQESGPELLSIKQQIYADLDRIAARDTILASSSSALVSSQFSAGLAGRARILVAHPVNPPHIIPVVELCPSVDTDPTVMDRAEALMREVGQVPVRLTREIDGFILNRLQAVLLAEAMSLIGQGLVTPQGLDDVIAHGLGRRWTLLGPLATINLNAPGGITDYLDRYGPTMARLSNSAARGEAFTVKTAEAIAATLPPPDQVSNLSRERDKRLSALSRFLKSPKKD